MNYIKNFLFIKLFYSIGASTLILATPPSSYEKKRTPSSSLLHQIGAALTSHSSKIDIPKPTHSHYSPLHSRTNSVDNTTINPEPKTSQSYETAIGSSGHAISSPIAIIGSASSTRTFSNSYLLERYTGDSSGNTTDDIDQIDQDKKNTSPKIAIQDNSDDQDLIFGEFELLSPEELQEAKKNSNKKNK